MALHRHKQSLTVTLDEASISRIDEIRQAFHTTRSGALRIIIQRGSLPEIGDRFNA